MALPVDPKGQAGSSDDELPAMLAGWDWSETNPPWAYTSASAWESKLPAGVPVVPLCATTLTSGCSRIM